jgi:putative hydrolase of the HAD superfamily
LTAPFRAREGRHAHLTDLRVFRGVEAWVFDLDNTLYPAHTNLFAQVDVRIRDYVARLLDVPADEANEIQKDYYRRYGTTLRGLMDERGISPDDFLEYVHDIDHSVIEPDPALDAALGSLPGASSSSPTARGCTPRRPPGGSASPAASTTSSTSSRPG